LSHFLSSCVCVYVCMYVDYISNFIILHFNHFFRCNKHKCMLILIRILTRKLKLKRTTNKFYSFIYLFIPKRTKQTTFRTLTRTHTHYLSIYLWLNWLMNWQLIASSHIHEREREVDSGKSIFLVIIMRTKRFILSFESFYLRSTFERTLTLTFSLSLDLSLSISLSISLSLSLVYIQYNK